MGVDGERASSGGVEPSPSDRVRGCVASAKRDVLHRPGPGEEEANMGRRHLPSIEALSEVSDDRLLAELEIRTALEKVARARAVVDRVDQLLHEILADERAQQQERQPRGLGPDARFVAADEAGIARELYDQILAVVRRKQGR
jgi:hypothetical protein